MPNARDPLSQLVLSLHRAHAKIERRLDRALSNLMGVSFSEYLLLRALGEAFNSSATRVDLADAVGLTASGVTRALRPLEKIGFVETTKDARDARRSLATLTTRGHETIANAEGVVAETLADVAPIQALATGERKRLRALFEEWARG